MHFIEAAYLLKKIKYSLNKLLNNYLVSKFIIKVVEYSKDTSNNYNKNIDKYIIVAQNYINLIF